jgi:hypothetical protein
MTTLLLSTPDGIPGNLLDLFRSSLIDIVVPKRGIPGRGGVDTLGWKLGELHDEVLGKQQKTWFQLNERGLPADKNEALLKKMRAIKSRLPADGNCGIHDAAMIFFAPLWRQVLPSPALLFYYSEPMETALHLRNSWRFPISAGLALWEYYVCTALNLLVEGEHVVVSSRKLRRDPTGQLLEMAARLEPLIPLKQAPRDVNKMARALCLDPVDDTLDPALYLNDAQKRLYSELESGGTGKSEHRICEQSRDLLFHYGNLRAGFEGVKQECRTLALALRRCGGNEEERMLEQRATVIPSVPDGDNNLLDVVVHIKHMKPLVFAAPPDSPILDMLFTALRAPATDAGRIIYLQYEAGESDAIYFPIGSLLAVDTTRATL